MCVSVCVSVCVCELCLSVWGCLSSVYTKWKVSACSKTVLIENNDLPVKNYWFLTFLSLAEAGDVKETQFYNKWEETAEGHNGNKMLIDPGLLCTGVREHIRRHRPYCHTWLDNDYCFARQKTTHFNQNTFWVWFLLQFLLRSEMRWQKWSQDCAQGRFFR